MNKIRMQIKTQAQVLTSGSAEYVDMGEFIASMRYVPTSHVLAYIWYCAV